MVKKYLCHWCRQEISRSNPYRTLENSIKRGTGWAVCGDDCPKKPEGAKVFAR
jgi:hypothetical protein